MSDFDKAIPIIMKWEIGNSKDGGLVDHPNDPGGITKYGISLKFLKTTDLKYDFNGYGAIDERTIKTLTEEQANVIYENEFWDKNHYSKINVQSVATYIFDMCVNMGALNAHKIAQRSIWAFDLDIKSIKDDGELGPKSLDAINRHGAFLLPVLRSGRNGYYREIIAKNPSLMAFKNGWKERTYGL